MRDGLEFLLDEPELTLLRRRRVLVVDLCWVGVLLLRRVLVLLVRRLLRLVEVLVVVLLLLLLVLLRREEFLLLLVVAVSLSESSAFLGTDLVINRLGLIGFTLMLAFLPVNLGRSGNFSTGIPSVASFMNCRQV